ncbi:helix-turn-helix transcriptional regulator [Salinispora arenicola]|uniref:Proteasome accessory factor C n=1 Tax=Salinispora arenicola TaxID=168697 RepID=A0A542XSF4_SALAC|nr:WYL domain-containing protein [Salinispora arenicola]MCN0153001.1 WYL domain-containing protein [Salinispora arenicola]TQL38761.1 proteasome accessory factor C [Salinispora arenicola]GIM85794.1 protein pafC [Salinispora arenicola]
MTRNVRAGSRASADRLARLLNLVPYLLARPGIEVAEAAGDLGVTERQLREDLELLWVCGLPGYGPGDLIDMAFDGDRVTITYDAGIDRPLRLTPDEALALVVALRMLAETPGVANREAVERALAKIENAAGDGLGAPVAVRLPADNRRVTELRAAVESGRALRITYYSVARDETIERIVDPLRMLIIGGRAYLEAWCRRAEGMRLFRVDRTDAVTRLAEPARVPPQAVPHDLTAGVFRPTPDLPLVTLRIGRGERWITEYYPCERVEQSDGEWLVSLRVTDLGWARRFVLGLGPEVTVVAPPELAAQVHAAATAALEAYAAPPPDPAAVEPMAPTAGQ